MRRILLTGKNGQVGWELQRTLATLGEVIAVDRQAMDLAVPDAVRRIIREIRPDLIVNAAAYTAVDKAESEPELAMAINGVAPGIMAEEAKQLGAMIVHYSTDYVFDGKKGTPYVETDEPNPLNVYGKTKLLGEQAIQAANGPFHLIFRTSWVYGARGENFLLTMLRLASERSELRIVADQIGTPNWSRMIAEATGQVLAQVFSPLVNRDIPPSEKKGIYHLAAAGQVSWYGFAQEIFCQAVTANPSGLFPAMLTPITSASYGSPAKRPANSILSTRKLTEEFGITLPTWQCSLGSCMNELTCNFDLSVTTHEISRNP